MTAALVLAALALGAVAAALVIRAATLLYRAAVVPCRPDTCTWDPARAEWVHHVDPLAPLADVLIGPLRRRRARRPPHVERPRR